MKKLVTLFSLVLLISSCSKENESIVAEESFQKQSLLVQKYLDSDTNSNANYSFKEINLDASIAEFGFSLSVTELVEINDNQKLVGYLLRNDDKYYVAQYRDDSHESFDLIDLEERTLNSFETRYNSELNLNVVYPQSYVLEEGKSDLVNQPIIGIDCNAQFTADVAYCVISSLLMAASDGPSPVMDILAAARFVTCNTKAAIDHTKCLEDQKDQGE